MSTIKVDAAGQDSIDRVSKILAGINGGAEKAIRSAMGRAVSHLRTNASREIREKYDISHSALQMEQNVKIRYATGNGIQAYVVFMGHKIPLYRFGGASPKEPTVNKSYMDNVFVHGFWKKLHPGIAASGHQLKNSSIAKFDNAFVARMASGHVGIFERTGGASSTGSDAIKEIMGSSIPQMLGNEEVADNLTRAAMDKFEERLDHEVLRILNGW